MPAKHALIIGVDRYPLLDAQYQLAGCVSDARLMRQILLERFGFVDADLHSLHDAEASREAILAAMQRLADSVERDDVVFFHFSGHGSRRTSASPDEASGKDSTIMPSDSGRRPHPNRDIVDDEINEWLMRLSARTRAISLLFDCCHSGTITRDPFAARTRAAPDDTRSLPELGLAPRAPGTRSLRGDAASSWAALGDAYVVMSGCRDNQYAHEFSEQRGGETIRHGALTHFLSRALLGAPAGSTWREVFDTAQRQVSARFASQHPQIEGARDRALFEGIDLPPMRFVSVEAVDGQRVTLAGGAAHGLQPGSQWTAYPAATRTPSADAVIGVIEIDRVGSLRAEGRLLQATDALLPGARCIESRPSLEQFRVDVDLGTLPPADAARITALIEASSLLRVASSADSAQLRIDVGTRGAEDAERRPGSQTPSAQRWVVIDRSGVEALPGLAIEAPDSAQTLVANLETLARYRNALALDNPDSRLQVDFRLLVESADGEWRPLAAGESVDEGECIAFEVVNRETRPVFISVLDFGLSGRIQLLYPPAKSSELLEAGQTLRIGCDRRRIRLGLPQGFLADAGNETFKLMVTLDESDFSWLQQSGTRAVDRSRSPLRALFRAALDGPKTRDALLEDGEAEDSAEDWAALNRMFVLKRRATGSASAPPE